VNFTSAYTVDDAVSALDAGARPIAGGSDLFVGHRQGKASLPDNVVAINRIPQLAEISQHDGGLTIGALVNHHVIEHHPVIASLWSALSDASALVGSPSTRNVGTIGGNVMNASPAMDTGAPLVVLGAEVELVSVHGLRRVPIAELWAGPGRTTAASNELCTALHLPAPADRSGSAYVRLEYRRAMEIAVVGAAASVTLDGDSIRSIAIALTAVAPTIVAVDGLDDLTGRAADNGLLATVALLASEQARPISDLRASDRYRRHCVGVMARRSVDAAVRRARGELIPVPVNRSIGIGAAS
jgi:CO/xanthine dehydrogenase FAD-binding subunit